MTKAFDGIAAGLEDAIAFVRGDTSRGRVAAGQPAPAEAKLANGHRGDQACPEPAEGAIRAKTKLSQANRKRAAGSTKPTNR